MIFGFCMKGTTVNVETKYVVTYLLGCNLGLHPFFPAGFLFALSVQQHNPSKNNRHQSIKQYRRGYPTNKSKEN